MQSGYKERASLKLSKTLDLLVYVLQTSLLFVFLFLDSQGQEVPKVYFPILHPAILQNVMGLVHADMGAYLSLEQPLGKVWLHQESRSCLSGWFSSDSMRVRIGVWWVRVTVITTGPYQPHEPCQRNIANHIRLVRRSYHTSIRRRRSHQMATSYFTFPAPSISSMASESLSTEPPGGNQPLLTPGPEAAATGADADSRNKHGNTTVTVLPVNGPDPRQRRRYAQKIGNTAYHYVRRLNPARLITGARNKWRSYFVEKKEVPKVVIHKGVNLAWFAHTWVHIPPTFATAVLLALNLWLYPNARVRGHYIGGMIPGPLEDETKLNWLQFSAKMHDILIVASLSTVMWDMTRYFLVYKPLGVPLGLVGAGSAFTEAKFLL